MLRMVWGIPGSAGFNRTAASFVPLSFSIANWLTLLMWSINFFRRGILCLPKTEKSGAGVQPKNFLSV